MSHSHPFVWLLEASDFNGILSHDPNTFIPGGDFTKFWLPGSVERNAPVDVSGGCTTDAPIAIQPPRTTNRIVAQQGVFTLHGAAQGHLKRITGQNRSIGLRR